MEALEGFLLGEFRGQEMEFLHHEEHEAETGFTALRLHSVRLRRGR
jgi:hypothetical protein